MTVLKYLILILYSFLILNGNICAQGTRLSNLGIEQGLSNNSVTSIFQDHNGFMWFGTFDGLNRYDGYEFKVYRNKLHDSTSLPTNRIVCIEEDKNHKIWVGTKKGVSIINNTQPGFRSIWYRPCGNGERQKLTNPVKDIKSDKSGNVFIATDGVGLLKAKRNSLEAVQVQISGDVGKICDYSVQAVKIDNKQRVWVFLNSKGLFLYDYAKGALNAVNTTIRTANCLEADNMGHLWIGSLDGLHKYDIDNKKYVAHIQEGREGLTSNRVISLFSVSQNEILIATDGGGVNILNPATGRFTYIIPSADQNAIRSSAVYAVYADKQGRKWIGTLRGGINIVAPRQNRFKTIARDPRDANSLVNDFVLSFEEEPSGNVWIGTDGGGLSIWNKNANTFTNYTHNSNNPASLSNNFITSILYDSHGQVWVGTYGGGINRFNKNTRQFEHFNALNYWRGPAPEIWTLYEDKSKNLWAGIIGGGLNRLNRATNQFELYDDTLKDVLTLTEDKNGVLWAGTFNRLIRIDPVHKKYEFFTVEKAVRAIQIDQSGILWLATEGYGLLAFDPVRKEFTSYSTEYGLKNPSVLTLLEDQKGNLWMSTFDGLAKFNKNTKRFQNFDVSDGLQSNQFNYNAAIRLSSGEFLFGGIKGLNIFYPDSIKPFTSVPPVFITGLKINNVAVYQDHRFVADADVDFIKALKIPYNHASIAIDMAALEFSAPEKIQYAYFLEGWDKDWNYAGSQRSAIYSNLREGDYVLKIKTTNSDGVWQDPKEVLRVHVLPPWYRSWWAYAIYILLIGFAVVAYQRYRAKQAKIKYEIALSKLDAEKKKSELERERTEREMTQAQYEKEKAERETERVISEREKEINEKRLSFFTSISHEFRTPLTLIINPVQDLLIRHKEDVDAKDLNTINRSARRLLNLVDQLLLFRKTESGAENLNIMRFNFSELCKDVYLYFVHEAKTRKITYHLECDKDVLDLYGDRNKIEIILYNLISNAFKYTPEGGRVQFAVKEATAHIRVLIRDSGCGITPEVGNKIFERFYQVESKSKTGFGIGLYLVKQFTSLHHGRISYQSKSGEGTCFDLELLKGKEHLGSLPVMETTPEVEIQENNRREIMEAIVDNSEDDATIPATPVVTNKKVLLVADDDKEIRKYIVELFSEQFLIYEASNGAEGLALTRKVEPDLVISDVMMPEMTGIEMCRKIKEDNVLNHIPVVLLTAMTSHEVQLEGVEGGADDYVTKPFSKDLLVARVNSLLKNRNNLHNYFYDQITLKNNDLKVPVEYKELLRKCIEVVENHLDDGDFTIQVLAKEMGMSHSYLYKRIKLISGQSANAFIRFLRLRKAAELLINTGATVNEAAYKVGFSDIKYFREQFNKLFGMNPSEYIKKYRKTLGEKYKVSKNKP